MNVKLNKRTIEMVSKALREAEKNGYTCSGVFLTLNDSPDPNEWRYPINIEYSLELKAESVKSDFPKLPFTEDE